jgi:hypothetical protein
MMESVGKRFGRRLNEISQRMPGDDSAALGDFNGNLTMKCHTNRFVIAFPKAAIGFPDAHFPQPSVGDSEHNAAN